MMMVMVMAMAMTMTLLSFSLLATVDIIEDPGRCSSADRCILAYLFDLYSSCSQLKVSRQLFSSLSIEQ